ncbi:MAG: response regulator transcription factor [Treponema sp.]|jgi:DNA-binding response OmpR family regulator|nr:response regulator transcription factor [Treponema sp.]
MSGASPHKPCIAVVDDEKNIREVIRLALEKEFFRVEEYRDGLAAWEAWYTGAVLRTPDLVILDITMPRMDGIELCRKIRSAGSAAPVIFLSSRDDEIDKVLGLESGGDDYVCKPFSLRELLARIRAGLRRANFGDGNRAGSAADPVAAGASAAAGAGAASLAEASPAATSAPGLLLDENRLSVFWKGLPLEFTVTEFRIIKSLAGRPGVIKTREQLMAAAFPEDSYPNDRAADSHIKRIRKKFLAADPLFYQLEAIYGLGYRWGERGC